MDEQFKQYDRNLTPAEVAAREEREGENYKAFPESEKEEGINTTDGYTMDREGKLNNFAIEPEMYINEPGDLRQQEEAETKAREEELKDVNTPGGKGPGVI